MTAAAERPADIKLPEGWTWERVEQQRAKWGLAANLVPVATALGAVAWGTIEFWRDEEFGHHRFWKIEGVYLGADGHESLIELRSLVEKPGSVAGPARPDHLHPRHQGNRLAADAPSRRLKGTPMTRIPETREDWTVIYGPQDDCQFFRKALWSEVQKWISDYLDGGTEFAVRCITVDEFCRDYTEGFTPPFDEDAVSTNYFAEQLRKSALARA